MPYKDPEKRKAYHKEQSRKYYETNREETIQRTKSNKAVQKEEWYKFKGALKCTKCGFDHIAALDFHHEDPSKKEYNVNRLVSNGQFKKAYKEITKCIVLCANCHRIHHHNEKTQPFELGFVLLDL